MSPNHLDPMLNPNTHDTRDRVIRLEAEVSELKRTVDRMSVKVTEMHDLLLQAKGARYIVVVAAGIGGFLSAKLGHFFPWIGGGNG